MNKKEIYLAGGCYWGVEKYLSNIKGVLETTVGFANGNTDYPTYEQVRYENTGHAETVKVIYDKEQLPLPILLKLFYRIIDPTSVNKQGEDEGHQYRTGIYFTDKEDEPIIMESLCELKQELEQKATTQMKETEDSHKTEKTLKVQISCKQLAIEAEPLRHFYNAEEYHQKYLDKNPNGYCHVPLAEILWVKTMNPLDKNIWGNTHIQAK